MFKHVANLRNRNFSDYALTSEGEEESEHVKNENEKDNEGNDQDDEDDDEEERKAVVDEASNPEEYADQIETSHGSAAEDEGNRKSEREIYDSSEERRDRKRRKKKKKKKKKRQRREYEEEQAKLSETLTEELHDVIKDEPIDEEVGNSESIEPNVEIKEELPCVVDSSKSDEPLFSQGTCFTGR